MRYLFATTDTKLAHRSGEIVEIGQPLATDSYDRAEVGPMVYVWFEDGDYAEAFVDELEEASCAACEAAGRPYDPDRHDSQNCWATAPSTD